MKKVWIDPGCITCGSCEFIAPEVFEVTDLARVRDKSDLEKQKELIEMAARACPVNVIKFQE
jgi:ferredoxin